LPAVALLLFAFAEPEYKAKPMETLNLVYIVQKGEKKQVIHGKVVQEETKRPLTGASIIIKGTNIGTVSDFEGNFTLTNPNPEVDEKTGGLITEFVISYVGYKTVSERFGPILGQADKENELTRYHFSMEKGVIVIDLPDYKNVPPPPPPPAISDDGEELFIIVEDLPKYPGGIYELAKYVAEYQEKLSKQEKIKGKVLVGFTVDEKGKAANIKIFDISDVKLKYALDKENKIEDAKVETSKDPKIQEAAVSIVKNMPDWSPGKQRGKPVPVNYILPIEF
jgi:hypothetical protein